MFQKNKIAIIGLGYVGLPLVCIVAKNKKYKVVGFDIEKRKIDLISKGVCPIDDMTVKKNLLKLKLNVSSDEHIIKNAEFIIVCVPTPIKSDKIPDLKPLIKACETIKNQLLRGQTVIIESTVNPGVCEEIVLSVLEKTGLKGGKDFSLSHCPERINPGDPIWDVNNIPRNIGSLTLEGNKKSADFYRSILKAPINELSCLKSAEATKVIENTFRDINIAYVNELAKSFDSMGIDIIEVMEGASSKPFAFMPHFPGCGVGGHCIPVDPYYLIDRAKKSGFDHAFLRLAREINNSMPKYTMDLLTEKLNEIKKPLNGTKILLLGLSYKADIKDLRESPALEIVHLLKKKKVDLIKYDPYFPEMSDVKTLKVGLEKAEAVVIATAHEEFTRINGKLLKKYNICVLIDGRNCLNKENILKYGILYKGIGH